MNPVGLVMRASLATKQTSLSGLNLGEGISVASYCLEVRTKGEQTSAGGVVE